MPPAALMNLKPGIMDSVYTRPLGATILSSDRVVQATFGPKVSTPRVPNSSIRCWMWSGKKQSVLSAPHHTHTTSSCFVFHRVVGGLAVALGLYLVSWSFEVHVFPGG